MGWGGKKKKKQINRNLEYDKGTKITVVAGSCGTEKGEVGGILRKMIRKGSGEVPFELKPVG